jgi:hypothetical protein
MLKLTDILRFIVTNKLAMKQLGMIVFVAVPPKELRIYRLGHYHP